MVVTPPHRFRFPSSEVVARFRSFPSFNFLISFLFSKKKIDLFAREAASFLPLRSPTLFLVQRSARARVSRDFYNNVRPSKVKQTTTTPGYSFTIGLGATKRSAIRIPPGTAVGWFLSRHRYHEEWDILQRLSNKRHSLYLATRDPKIRQHSNTRLLGARGRTTAREESRVGSTKSHSIDSTDRVKMIVHIYPTDSKTCSKKKNERNFISILFRSSEISLYRSNRFLSSRYISRARAQEERHDSIYLRSLQVLLALGNVEYLGEQRR